MHRDANGRIPFRYFYENGMCELPGGFFSGCISVGELNFETESAEEEKRMLKAFGEMLDSIGDGNSLQILMVTGRSERSRLFEKVRFRPGESSENSLRHLSNSWLLNEIGNGERGLTRETFFLPGTVQRDTLKAREELRSAEERIISGLSRISARITAEKTGLRKRLSMLQAMYHPDGEMLPVFEDTEEEEFMKKLSSCGLSLRDAVAPSALTFQKSTFTAGHCIGRVWSLEKTGRTLSTDFLAQLSSLEVPSIVSIHFKPVPVEKTLRMVENRILGLKGELASGGGTMTKSAHDGAVDLMNDFVNRKMRAYSVSLTLAVFASSKEELERISGRAASIASREQASFRTLLFRQEEGLNSCLPFGRCFLPEKKLFTTETASVFFPFSTCRLQEESGLYYGRNRLNRTPVFMDRLTGKNHSLLYFGMSGSGKSAAVKIEILQALLRNPESRALIIDPCGDYARLAEKMNGEVIRIAPGSRTALNPLDLNPAAGEADPVAAKTDYLFGLFEMMLGKEVLSAAEQSVISRCVREIYRGYVENGRLLTDVKAHVFPTLADLYEELRKQPEEEAQAVAEGIEMYASGAMELFSGRTNRDTDRRLIVFDLSRLGAGTRALGLYVCLNEIWNRTLLNAEEGRYTWSVIDEMQSVMTSVSAAAFISGMFAMLRKWKGVPSGILQNTNPLFFSQEGRNILGNAGGIIAMSMKQTDRKNLSEFLELSETEENFLRDTKPGQGLLVTEGLKIPFDLRLDKDRDPELYELINTSGEWTNRNYGKE